MSTHARNRRYVRVLFKFQKGACVICREQMILVKHDDIKNYEHPLRASLEHIDPISDFPDKKSKFSNFMASHKSCNSNRSSAKPTDDMLAFREIVHRDIFEAQNPHFVRPPNGGKWDINAIEFIRPFGVSVEEFLAQEK